MTEGNMRIITLVEHVPTQEGSLLGQRTLRATKTIVLTDPDPATLDKEALRLWWELVGTRVNNIEEYGSLRDSFWRERSFAFDTGGGVYVSTPDAVRGVWVASEADLAWEMTLQVVNDYAVFAPDALADHKFYLGAALWLHRQCAPKYAAGWDGTVLTMFLRDSLEVFIAENWEPKESERIVVKAETHDDERRYEIPSFDATPWFWQATAEEIVALAGISWGGDYSADAVAEFFNTERWAACDPAYAEITVMFEHKRDGFECHVDQESAMAWLAHHRPVLHQELLTEALL